ncbi:MAG: hypothetical protein AVDCRST_MAG50-2097, partial [uncultured Acidimicrobiales bacterium]
GPQRAVKRLPRPGGGLRFGHCRYLSGPGSPGAGVGCPLGRLPGLGPGRPGREGLRRAARAAAPVGTGGGPGPHPRGAACGLPRLAPGLGDGSRRAGGGRHRRLRRPLARPDHRTRGGRRSALRGWRSPGCPAGTRHPGCGRRPPRPPRRPARRHPRAGGGCLHRRSRRVLGCKRERSRPGRHRWHARGPRGRHRPRPGDRHPQGDRPQRRRRLPHAPHGRGGRRPVPRPHVRPVRGHHPPRAVEPRRRGVHRRGRLAGEADRPAGAPGAVGGDHDDAHRPGRHHVRGGRPRHHAHRVGQARRARRGPAQPGHPVRHHAAEQQPVRQLQGGLL